MRNSGKKKNRNTIEEKTIAGGYVSPCHFVPMATSNPDPCRQSYPLADEQSQRMGLYAAVMAIISEAAE